MVAALFLLAALAGGLVQTEATPFNLVFLTTSQPDLVVPDAGDICGEEGTDGCCGGLLDAVQLAVDEVNRNSTLLAGHSLTITHYPADAVSLVNDS